MRSIREKVDKRMRVDARAYHRGRAIQMMIRRNIIASILIHSGIFIRGDSVFGASGCGISSSDSTTNAP